MPAKEDIRWFKQQFQAEIEQAVGPVNDRPRCFGGCSIWDGARGREGGRIPWQGIDQLQR